MIISRYTESLEYNLQATARVLREAICEYFKKSALDISYDEFIILDEVFHQQGILPFALAKNILKGRAYTGKFVAILEQKKYLHRENAIKGKTQVVTPIYITKEGIVVHKKAVELVKSLVDTLPIIENSDLNTIVSFLHSLKADTEKKYKVKFI